MTPPIPTATVRRTRGAGALLAARAGDHVFAPVAGEVVATSCERRPALLLLRTGGAELHAVHGMHALKVDVGDQVAEGDDVGLAGGVIRWAIYREASR